MLIPQLTEYDPVTLSEGSLDPLGLYSIADKMGVLLAPGIRERQLHPLFLTAIAACTHICSEFDDDTVANDGVSKPWQVCEWYVVEAITRKAKNNSEIRGLPGRQKAQASIESGMGLSAARYLKTPSVFGFHGVYRLLARTLDIIDNYDRLGANGYELLAVWQAEQNLPGFLSGSTGRGRAFLDRMRVAVEIGLKAGKTTRSSGWAGWTEIFHYLRHTRKPEGESSLIRQWLTKGESRLLAEIYGCLLSRRGRALWLDSAGSEQAFHRFAREGCSPDLGELIDGIADYERFCWAVLKAFNATLSVLSDRQLGAKLSEISDNRHVVEAAATASELYYAAEQSLAPLGFAVEFERSFGAFVESMPPADWLETLIRHHERVQKAKPPAGKLPWIDRFSNGTVFVRPPYQQESLPDVPDEDLYVHQYRTNSLWSFAFDLGMV